MEHERVRQKFSLISIKKNPWLYATLATILFFVFLRAWRLHLPMETVFDEVYFPKMASQYLNHEAFFDIHPPLGKLMIALGELAFGKATSGWRQTVGWRIVPLLFGIAILPTAYWAVKTIFSDKRAGLIAALLLSIDGLFIVYSRTGLMDMFILTFGLVAFTFCWRFLQERFAGERAWLFLLLTGLFAGLAVAVKWIGAGFLPVVALTTFIAIFFNRKRPITFADFFVWFLSLFVLPAVLYILPFIANRVIDPIWHNNFWGQFVTWHQQSWGYNVHLNATHPYASKWWSWPFLIRPIWFYYKNINGNIVGVDGIGNPLVWWGSTLAVVYTTLVLIYSLLVWKRKESQVITRDQFWPLLFILGGWASFYLPWVKIGRVLFLYHYFTSYLFALLLAAFWLSQAMHEKRSRILVILALVAAVLVGLWFVPIWIAYPISQTWFNHLMWFKSWI